MEANNPTAFISYAWENENLKSWVKDLATNLRNEGIDAKLDQWEVVPGDQMPHFMEKSVRENNYVLIICTEKYKTKSENRIGGVGYEGDIMTSEVLESSNHRKFIPILKSGNKEISIPSWLKGKYYIDFSTEQHFKNNFSDLITTILNTREIPPALGQIKTNPVRQQTIIQDASENEDIKIKGINVDQVTKPTLDGSPGSALYKIPFELNKKPDYTWRELFINSWNWPPSFSSMHRPGIASVIGNQIILDGTDIEEVEKYHKETLKLCVKEANRKYNEIIERRKQEAAIQKQREDEHQQKLNEISGRLDFD